MAPPARTRRTLASSDLAAAAMDLYAYSRPLKASRKGRPLGSTPLLLKGAKKKAVASTKRMVLPRDGIFLDMDVCKNSPHMEDVLKRALQVEYPPVCAKDIPVSPFSHDCRQLFWGREHVPLCASQGECIATMFSGNHGPLHAYLTTTEQRALDKGTAIKIDDDRTCILCIRQQCSKMQTVSMALGKAHWASKIAPPFTNLFNCVEGYSDKYLGAVAPTTSGDVRVAVVANVMSVRIQQNGGWYLDQSCMAADYVAPKHNMCVS